MGKEIKNDGIIIKVTVMEGAFQKDNVRISFQSDTYSFEAWVNKNQLNKEGCWTGLYEFGPNDDIPPRDPRGGN